MTLDELIITAVNKYQFRRQLRTETAAAYRNALITHVEVRDFSAAHELRVGKVQAAWTKDEIAQFRDRILRMPGPQREFAPGTEPFALAIVGTEPGSEAVTEANLRALAERGLNGLIDHRREEPEWECPIYISVLLWNGALLTTVTQRQNRVAVIKHLARNAPVFGFFVGADMFLHSFSKDTAQRQEGILMHLGTRELRVTRVATYTRTAAGIVFAAPFEMDMRQPNVEDPYSEIFVSGAPPTGRPS
jgi:hypothetical protein